MFRYKTLQKKKMKVICDIFTSHFLFFFPRISRYLHRDIPQLKRDQVISEHYRLRLFPFTSCVRINPAIVPVHMTSQPSTKMFHFKISHFLK